MAKITLDREQRRNIFKQIKPTFKDKLGRYTHQRVSDSWHFLGLGFVREEMTYVFGINIGFFLKEENYNLPYSHVGMNVLIRTNGINEDLRRKYKEFFDKHLSSWIKSKQNSYSSFRGGVGVELPHIVPISNFSDTTEITDFLKNSIIKLSQIYPFITSNPESIFTHIVRAAPPWHDTILEMALKRAGNIVSD